MNTIRKHWLSLIGLAMVGLAIYFNLNWIWGLLFLFWVVPALFTGVTYLGEPIERKTSPVLFWIVTLLWLSTSAYMVAEPFLDAPYRYSTAATAAEYTEPPKDAIPAAASGVYTDSTLGNSSKREVAEDIALDSLKYKAFHAPEQTFIGVAETTTYEGDRYLQDIEALWGYFMENDISEAIPNIVDERVYLLYSDYDKAGNGTFKVTIGYRTSDLSYIYEGLEGITVPEMDFAVFESDGDPEAFVARTWEEVAASDLPRANTVDLEVYRLDAKTYDITQAEVRISTKTK